MRSLLTALLVLVPALAAAAPWDGPRVIHDGADPARELALHPVPGAFTVTWAPGPEASRPADVAPPTRPRTLTVDGWTLRRVGPVGATRLHTDRYELGGEGRADAFAVARALGTLDDVVVAGPLFALAPVDGAPWRAVTPKVLLQLTDPFDETAMRDLADRLGVVVDGPRGLAPDQWRLLVPARATVDPVEVAAAFHAEPWTRWAAVSWIQQREAREPPDDPEFPNQWHLENTGQTTDAVVGEDIGFLEAYDIEPGSDDVVLAFMDSGVQTDHPDLAEHVVAGYDFLDGDDDPNPNGSSHGTSGAGLAAAPANGVGVVGACPGCLIMPLRMLGADDEAEADALDWGTQNGAWAINNSWGPTDGTGVYTPMHAPMVTAVEYATEFGRDGKGVAIFWAAGNGAPVDTCDLDGFVAHPRTIAVGSSSNKALYATYSEACAELDLVAPSSGGSNGTASLTTTNLDGYTSNFGGTSAAAPVATGVGGLVLSALPDLGWQDLRQLLRNSAAKIDPDGADYDELGHSLQYGYGRVDAHAALEAEVAFLTVEGGVVPCDVTLDATVNVLAAAGAGTVEIVATSPTEPDGELFTLTETDPGRFVGTLALSGDPAAAGDGVLSVTDGDVVTVTTDEVEDPATLLVDCAAPQILNPRVEVVQHWGAQVVWETDEPADSRIDFGAGEDDYEDDGALVTEHALWAIDLEPCTDHVASITSADATGNTTTAADAVAWTTPGDPADLPTDALLDADPCDPDTWYGDGDDDDDDSTNPGDGCETGCQGANASLLLLLGGFALRRRLDHT